MKSIKTMGCALVLLLTAAGIAAPLELCPETMRDGKIAGTVTWIKGFDGGEAIRLQDAGSSVEIPYPANPEATAVEAWIKLPEKPVFRHLFRRRGKNNQWQLYVAPAGGNDYSLHGMSWKATDGQNNFVGTSSLKLQGGKFYHIAMELDGTRSGKLFVNGEEVCSGVPVDAIRAGSSPITIGGGKPGEPGALVLQNVIVYDSKLPENWRKRVLERLKPWEKRFAPDEVLNFSTKGAWVTAPVELLKVMPENQMWSARTRFGNDPARRMERKTMRQLALGAEVGKDGLRWNHHPLYPTLHASQVPADWSKPGAVALKLFSKTATGETVFLAFSSDSKATPYRDYYVFPLAVNFTGEKTIVIPEAKFKKSGTPAGWNHIDGVYFFTKMFGAQPHPATDLVLKSLRPVSPEKENSAEFTGELRREKDADGFVFRMVKAEYQRQYLNHTFPETRDGKPVFAPYAHQPYEVCERGEFDYFPNFLPGYVSYTPDGKAYVNSGDLVQYKGPDGKWRYTDLVPVLKKWAKERHWSGMQLSWGLSIGEKAIRTDKDGDFYLMIPVEALDAEGKTFDWHTRTVLLLHSRDKLKTFEVYPLPAPGRLAAFEKLDGHNTDCLKRPPVILMGDYSYFPDGDPAGYLLTPKKKSDGTLDLGTPVKYAEFAISPDQHSGGGNRAITRGDKLFIVFGVASVNAIAMRKVKGAAKTMLPPIPPDHPGLKLSYQYQSHYKTFTGYSKNGTPAFIVEYDLKTGKLGKARYLLSGGIHDDGHNWPSITVDSHGILHVIANGHHDPVAYTHSLKPDAPYGSWSAPVYIEPGKQTPRLSYATLNCGKDDTLYTVHRSTTGVYNNHLGFYFKPAGKPWRGEDVPVTPYRYMYKVWGQKAMYNPATGGITLGFYSHSSMKQLSLDSYLFDIFYHPDQEQVYRGGKRDPGVPGGVRCKMYVGQPSELTLLTCDPAAKKWKLTGGDDLK